MNEHHVESREIDLRDYRPHPRNSYRHHPEPQINHLCRSLEKYGQVRSIVVWEQPHTSKGRKYRGYILAGHGIHLAAQALGWHSLRADVLPKQFDKDKAQSYLVADNRLAELADVDMHQLAALVNEAIDHDEGLLEAMGYGQDEFGSLLLQLDAETQSFDHPDPTIEEPFPVYDRSGNRVECPECGAKFTAGAPA